jgi:hypothetical protein
MALTLISVHSPSNDQITKRHAALLERRTREKNLLPFQQYGDAL